MVDSEIWKDISGYEGFYQASNLGNIKSLKFGKEKIMKLCLSGSGYLIVSLCKNGVIKEFRVHRLVWEAFNGKTHLQVDHIIEGNKLDNRLCNLQAITQRENISKHRLTVKKSSKYTGISWHKNRNKWRSKITINGKINNLGYFNTEEEAHQAYQNKLLTIKPTNNE